MLKIYKKIEDFSDCFFEEKMKRIIHSFIKFKGNVETIFSIFSIKTSDKISNIQLFGSKFEKELV